MLKLSLYDAIKKNPQSPGHPSIQIAESEYRAEFIKSTNEARQYVKAEYAKVIESDRQHRLRKTAIERELREAEERHKASLRTS